MAMYRMYDVGMVRIKPGKNAEALKWWQEKGKALLESLPGTKSLKAYAVQFGFGGEYNLQIWRELDSYGSYDRLDEDMFAHPEKYTAFAETMEFFEWGPAHLMGDWPESQLPPQAE